MTFQSMPRASSKPTIPPDRRGARQYADAGDEAIASACAAAAVAVPDLREDERSRRLLASCRAAAARARGPSCMTCAIARPGCRAHGSRASSSARAYSSSCSPRSSRKAATSRRSSTPPTPTHRSRRAPICGGCSSRWSGGRVRRKQLPVRVQRRGRRHGVGARGGMSGRGQGASVASRDLGPRGRGVRRPRSRMSAFRREFLVGPWPLEPRRRALAPAEEIEAVGVHRLARRRTRAVRRRRRAPAADSRVCRDGLGQPDRSITAAALRARSAAIAEGLAVSVTGGTGQFCTKPGVVLVPPTTTASAFVDDVVDRLDAVAARPLLNARIYSALLPRGRSRRSFDLGRPRRRRRLDAGQRRRARGTAAAYLQAPVAYAIDGRHRRAPPGPARGALRAGRAVRPLRGDRARRRGCSTRSRVS